MKIYTKIVFQMGDDPTEYLPLESHSFEYDGPIARCDRSVQGASQQNAKTAGAAASNYGNAAGGVAGTLLPQLTQDATNPTGFDPTTKNNMLVAGEQGAGGTNAAISGEASARAARTRNSGALSGVLDQAARRMGQTNSENALNVEDASAKLAQQKRSQALSGLNSIYGTDVGAQFKGLNQQNEDENTALNAGNSGWLQNTMGVIGTLGKAANGPLTYV